MSRVVGVDPGGTETGVVVLEDGELIFSWTVKVPAMQVPVPDPGYLQAVLRCLGALVGPFDLLAAEGIVKPTGHMGKIDPTPNAVAAGVVGVCIGWCAFNDVAFQLVRPDGHGSNPFWQYPAALHDPRGACKAGQGTKHNERCAAPKGAHRHMRSAYDVAREGRRQRRLVLASLPKV